MLRRLILLLAIVLLWDGSAQAQSTGTLLPNVPGQFLDSNGNVCAACTLYSYTAGTTTAQDTFSDAALTVANTNPITLNSAGLNPAGGIYLSATNYKLILKTAAGATIWTRDNVAAVPYTTTASALNATCDGRLTLTTATPVTTTDVTFATTVYFTPYKGNRCALYDGSQWNISTFSQLSLSLGADTSGFNYDVFLYLNAGTMTLERVGWSTDTVRSTAITLQDGVYVKSGATGRRYVGTYRTVGIGLTEDSAARRFVWNYYNRVARTLSVTEATDSWTYTIAAFRQANGSATNQVAVVVGVGETIITLRVVGLATNNAATPTVSVGIGEDSTLAAATGTLLQSGNAQATVTALPNASLVKFPAIGYHFYAWLEYSAAAGTTTWYGDGAVPSIQQMGIAGFIEG